MGRESWKVRFRTSHPHLLQFRCNFCQVCRLWRCVRPVSPHAQVASHCHNRRKIRLSQIAWRPQYDSESCSDDSFNRWYAFISGKKHVLNKLHWAIMSSLEADLSFYCGGALWWSRNGKLPIFQYKVEQDADEAILQKLVAN